MAAMARRVCPTIDTASTIEHVDATAGCYAEPAPPQMHPPPPGSLPRCRKLGLGSARDQPADPRHSPSRPTGPCQAPPANSDVTDPNDDAAACNSSAPSQAPPPIVAVTRRYIRSELVSEATTRNRHARPSHH